MKPGIIIMIRGVDLWVHMELEKETLLVRTFYNFVCARVQNSSQPHSLISADHMIMHKDLLGLYHKNMLTSALIAKQYKFKHVLATSGPFFYII